MLIDFGFSKNHLRYSMQTSLGTPLYCAPEILDDREYSPACDMYSVGMIIFYLIE